MYRIPCHRPPAVWPMYSCSYARCTPCVRHTWCPLASSRISFHQLFFLFLVFSSLLGQTQMQIYCDFFFFNLKNLSTTKLFTATVPFMAVFLENFSTINSIRMGICDVRFSAVLPVFRKTMPDQGRMQVFVEQILYLDFFFCSLWLNSYIKLYIFVKKLLSIWLHWVLVVACRFFSCSMQTLSWGMQGLVYWPGIESRSPALGVQSLSHWTTWEVPLFDSIRNPFFTCLNGSIWHYWSFSLSWSSFSWLSPENIALFWFLISLTGHTSLSWFFFIHSLKVRVC